MFAFAIDTAIALSRALDFRRSAFLNPLTSYFLRMSALSIGPQLALSRELTGLPMSPILFAMQPPFPPYARRDSIRKD
jgi:hypothetical protein